MFYTSSLHPTSVLVDVVTSFSFAAFIQVVEHSQDFFIVNRAEFTLSF